jgi:four helix bundle protein
MAAVSFTGAVAVRSHRELVAWQKAFALAVICHEIADRIPRPRRTTIAAQLERAALSVPANIAEGHGRFHRADYLRFLDIAHGSLTEVDTHLRLIVACRYLAEPRVGEAIALVEEVGRLLGGLIRALRGTRPRPLRAPTPAPPPASGSAAPSSPAPPPSGR